MTINEKIHELRQWMKKFNLDAYIIPSTDPHISEYVAECWTSRSWISGFDGSAGTVVITQSIAGLWTDSRYFLQAERQLQNSEFQLFKLGLPDTLDYPEWLAANLGRGSFVGCDGKVLPQSLMTKIRSTLQSKAIEFVLEFDIIKEIWQNRPEIPKNKLFLQDVKYAGKSRTEKIKEVRKMMAVHDANCFAIATLDDINWLFNIRGTDVAYNPVVICYALITTDEQELYIYDEKLDAVTRAELEKDGVKIMPYDDIYHRITHLNAADTIYMDPARMNSWLMGAVPHHTRLIQGMNFTTILKAKKNATEIQGVKNAMKRDCVSMLNFLKWFENTLGQEKLTEVSVGQKLREFRAQSDMFFGESFATIAGYRGHGAIVHYSANAETDAEIKPEGFFLLDSGGQYYDGTTDITRVFHLSTPTEEEMIDYTLVLKGHINLGTARYPVGTRGSQLDVLARKFLWDEGFNYLHGTGHGVGCFMNVHEGPQNIRMEENPTVLEVGMITSNEPGIYRAGKHGIRIENLVVTVSDIETDFGKFLKFDTITLFPIETKAIKVDMLTDMERKWFNNYHKMVYDEVSPLLDEEMKAYLKEKTKPI